MPQFTTLTAGQRDADSPIDQALIDALYNNPSCVMLNSATASASAVIDFTGLTSTYDVYLVKMTHVIPATNAVSLNLRFSVDNGSTFESGATDYKFAVNAYAASGVSKSQGSTGNSAIALHGTDNITNTTSHGGLSGVIVLYGLSATSTQKSCSFNTVYDVSTNFSACYGGGVAAGSALQTNDVDAIRFFMSSGNIATGEFYLYGIRV